MRWLLARRQCDTIAGAKKRLEVRQRCRQRGRRDALQRTGNAAVDAAQCLEHLQQLRQRHALEIREVTQRRCKPLQRDVDGAAGGRAIRIEPHQRVDTACGRGAHADAVRRRVRAVAAHGDRQSFE